MPAAAFQTPLVERSIKAQYKLQAGDTAIKWCFINVLLCALFALGAGGHVISSLIDLDPQHVIYAYYLEISLSVVCGISAICDIITFLSSRKFRDHLSALSPAQALLLNIKSMATKPVIICSDDSPGTPSPINGSTTPSIGYPLCHHLSTSLNATSLNSLNMSHPTSHSAPVTPHNTPRSSIHAHREPFTPPLSTSQSANNSLVINSFNNNSFQSMNASFHSLAPTNMNNTSFNTPVRDVRESDSVYHLSVSPKIRKTVSDLNNLSDYLQEYEEKEKWLTRGSSDRGVSSGWAPRVTETLPPRPYFLASQSQIVSVSGDTSYYNQQAADALLERLGISSHSLDIWTENVRKWISQTIFQHLQREIQTINSSLEQVGSAECKIGSVSTAVLSKISANKHEHMANIALLLPYLEVSVNQDYLVKRIGELASGSCLGCFRWESGGRYKNSSWNKELPTDSQIVMHCIATYLDSHLPRNPMYPEGRTFTTHYFIQTPIKADTKKKEYAVFQSSIHPPHYKLLTGEEVWEVSKARNNLFHTFILLLYHLREEHHGMLGPVHLGPTGLNIMWIIS